MYIVDPLYLNSFEHIADMAHRRTVNMDYLETKGGLLVKKIKKNQKG
jgi:hypothetical protein